MSGSADPRTAARPAESGPAESGPAESRPAESRPAGSRPAEPDAVRLLCATLDLAHKVRLLTGDTFWSLPAEPAVGLRRLMVSDGPAGVRGETFDERDPSLSLPSATALAATWDAGLARRYGAALGIEARRKGVDVVLGPTINLHRTPFGGRHFEAFSEDPLLTGEVAAAYVAGMQAQGVAATPKHYVANDAETDRFTADSQVDAQTLRECYLAPFESVVAAGAWVVMSSYNATNGTTMSENALLRSPLKDEWGFDGVVVSDWTAVRSTEASAASAQDLVMPGPAPQWGDALVAAVRAGRVPEAAVDEKVERLLRLAARVGALDGIAAAVAEPPAAEDGTALARDVATAGMVLVRNAPVDGVPVLPWAQPGSVAVLGHNAVVARTQGGGSATVRPREVVSPLDGLRAALGDRVRYRIGALVAQGVQALAPSSLTNPGSGAPGVLVRYLDAQGAELAREDRLWVELVWLGSGLPAGTVTVELATRWAAPPGRHLLGARALGALHLTVDGETVLDTVTDSDADRFIGAFADPPSATVEVDVAGPGPVELVLRHTLESPVRAVTLGVRPTVADADAEIAAAAALAGGCDVALVVVGTNEQVESEGFDRDSLALPGRQDDLVRAVAAANPRTVVLVNSGAPVLMPWRDEVAAVLLGWFGGERFGEAVADVLLGRREPGGRLPTTWPATGAERAVLSGVPVDGAVVYAEGVHVGYRGWLRTGEAPAYPFGHGLGYTSWALRSARVRTEGPGAGAGVVVEVELDNTGDRPGRQVVQVYLSRPGSAVERPARWLAGWAVVDAPPGPATVAVALARRAFAHWAGSRWEVEPGEFTVHLGTSVSDTPLTAAVAVF